jgi:DNA helicase HerA-like ATPase
MDRSSRLGFLKSGSTSEGFIVRIGDDVSLESLRIGDFVVVEGKIFRFFGIVDDLKILSDTEEVFFDPPSSDIEKLAMKGSIVYSEAQISPYLMVDESGSLHSIKTMPEHFSIARKAQENDLELIFKSQAKMPFNIGSPLTMEGNKIHVDLKKLSMRNNGIFGITGSGKTILAKIVFSGMIKTNIASLLVFDMHNEYGRFAKGEEGISPALKSFFPDRVKVFDVSVKNKDADEYIRLPLKYIEPEDLSLISSVLNYSERSGETAFIVARKKGKNWLKYLFSLHEKNDEEISFEAQSLGVNAASLSALARHTFQLRKLDFLEDTDEESAIDLMLSYLRNGVSVIVQFSKEYANNPLAYFLVSNVISRRIHRRYEDLTEDEREKRRIIIVIEEAHKFLSTDMREGNIFGTIAREMRKFNVTLFIIDQRPSGIDPEVLSQVGTRFTLQLLDDGDIDSVFQGVGGGARLKKILRSIEPRQALLFGYALPMPVAMKVRSFGEEFFKEIQDKIEDKEKAIKDLYD